MGTPTLVIAHTDAEAANLLTSDIDERDRPFIDADRDRTTERIVLGERRLFEVRRSFRAGQIAQLGERAEQLSQEIEGLEAQVVKDRETTLILDELAGVQQLLAQG